MFDWNAARLQPQAVMLTAIKHSERTPSRHLLCHIENIRAHDSLGGANLFAQPPADCQLTTKPNSCSNASGEHASCLARKKSNDV